MVRWYNDSKVLEMSRIKKEVFMKPVNIEIYTTMARAGTAGFRNTPPLLDPLGVQHYFGLPAGILSSSAGWLVSETDSSFNIITVCTLTSLNTYLFVVSITFSLPFFFIITGTRNFKRNQFQYTTFTDRALEDWAEIWGERNFFL